MKKWILTRAWASGVQTPVFSPPHATKISPAPVKTTSAPAKFAKCENKLMQIFRFKIEAHNMKLMFFLYELN